MGERVDRLGPSWAERRRRMRGREERERGDGPGCLIFFFRNRVLQLLPSSSQLCQPDGANKQGVLTDIQSTEYGCAVVEATLL
jgi:hypothetical protein